MLMFSTVPELDALVIATSVNLVKSRIKVSLRETVDLDGIRLLENMFGETFSTLLRLNDPSGKITGEICFFGCEIEDHETEFSYGSGQYVVHEIAITYKDKDILVASEVGSSTTLEM